MYLFKNKTVTEHNSIFLYIQIAVDLIRKTDALCVRTIIAMQLPAPGVRVAAPGARVATLTTTPANASVSNDTSANRCNGSEIPQDCL